MTRAAWAVWLVASLPATVFAQHEQHGPAATTRGWTGSIASQVFLNLNLQERKFRDFHHVESLNWVMLAGGRAIGRGALGLQAMLSAEPFTLRELGSAQVFQTGETYQGAALVDYQHPHDLVMQASARFMWPLDDRWRLRLEGGPVASPALGPPPFMHRPSADGNPTAPLGHHMQDATHISHGVLTLGITRSTVDVDVSAFHGREPDENRVHVEFGPLDSVAARVGWRRGGWQAQVSAAHLTFPDKTEFTDVRRLTASLGYTGEWRARPIAWLLVFGINRELALDVTTPSWLAEGSWRRTARDTIYARAEWLEKDLLTLGGYDPPGFEHPHVLSTIGALTVGYLYELAATRAGRFGVGADATVYYRDPNLAEYYGHPFSAHVFLRYRFAR